MTNNNPRVRNNIGLQTGHHKDSSLEFKPFSLKDVKKLDSVFNTAAHFRSCDFTLGGMYMWINYFGYRHAMTANGTLYVSGLSEEDTLTPAFSLPLGCDSPDAGVEELREYCTRQHRQLRLSAVPESALETLQSCNPKYIKELPQWADYLYNAEDLATLTGKRFNKKRNHVNRFLTDNPGFCFRPLIDEDIPQVLGFLKQLTPDTENPMAIYEHSQTVRLVERLKEFPMEGGVLQTPSDGIVAFTIGETRGDTLHLHIEKMRHDIPGAGESINKFFAEYMLQQYPELQYINRQDDGGDPGLRQAKLSYHPVRMVKKFEVIF